MDENENIDKLVSINLVDEMKVSFIDYAMSVIVSRALPDVRDGLKPVHRRILYSMNELNLDPTKAYKKSARIVGDTMGKYHPHGDSSIYEAMVRMAQDFSMRYMLVDGHGNFGSMDGDSAAAQRYTEARLSRLSMEMLADIEKNTVDFAPTYDEESKEPTVLPARIPNLLVNGSSGIAVGMATNIPPHNLTEVIDAIILMIDNHVNENRETEISELIDIIKGPDFPTGATIVGNAGIKQAYLTGRGKIRTRADAHIEPMSNDREMIVVTQIPYQVNKAKLVEKIAELVKEKKVEGISDLRDESDRNGIRVVVELKKDVNSNVILNQLYKYSQLQESFGVNMIALVNNEPKTLNLLQILNHYINHQKEVITRRTKFELDKAEKRAHILQGYIIALDNIDEVIKIIRSSNDSTEAKARLIERFSLSEAQSQAIVDMRLKSLTGLERDKIEEEFAKLQELIKELNLILDNEKILYAVIREEILIVKTKYGDERRTKIVPDMGEFDMEDLIDDEANVITMTHLNYIKRLPINTYKSQNRGGRGVIGLQMREEDLVKDMFIASTHEDLLFFTDRGKVHRIKAYQVPEAGRVAKGTSIVNLINISSNEKVTAVIPVREYAEEEHLMMVTKNGVIKKTSMQKFSSINKNGLIALTLREDDQLIAVLRTDGNKEIFLATKNGMGIRFSEENVRMMGRTAAGVRSMKLKNSDYIIGAVVLEIDKKVLFVAENGYGKCSLIDEFRMQTRGGFGTRIYKITEKTGDLVGISLADESEELMIINSDGVIIRIKIDEISTIGRVTQGVKLINLSNDSKVISIAKISKDYISEDEDLEDSELSENEANSVENVDIDIDTNINVDDNNLEVENISDEFIENPNDTSLDRLLNNIEEEKENSFDNNDENEENQ